MPAPVKRKPTTNIPNDTNDESPLRAYIFHGLDLDSTGKGEQVIDCPFCGKEKFSVNSKNGHWQCFTCGEIGGVWKFLELLYKISDESTTSYQDLATDRGLEFPDTLVSWGICKSILTDNWLVPGYSLGKDGVLRLQQLYQYSQVGERMALMPTPGQKHTLWGLNIFDKKKPDVYLTEGIWDALRLWEVLRFTKQDDEGNLENTANVTHCLLSKVNVLAVPSCTAFGDNLANWVKGKSVAVMFDNDYPNTHPKTKQLLPPAGFKGMQRAAGICQSTAEHTFYLNWGPEGYDPTQSDGKDLRDLLGEDKHEGLAYLLNNLELAPSEWTKEAKAEPSLKPKPCDNWKTLVNAWRKAVKWTPGLEHGLATSLAVVASTMSIGDQLFLRIMGPASCGKTTLVEAIGVNHKYTKSLSTLTGFHSGFIAKGVDGKLQDNNLITQINGKTLITKDGDTLLKAGNKEQILSEARDLYDGSSRSHYKTGMGKDHEGLRTTWLLCGTSALHKLDDSELGERFLDCVVMDRIEPQLEDDILWRVANRAVENVGVEVNCSGRSNHTPAMCEAMELTGGYVEWLRNNAGTILPTIEFSDANRGICISLAKWVAYMRAKKNERELAARLTSQHIRLAKCKAFVFNKSSVDGDIMSRITQIGMDTAKGNSLEIVRTIYDNQQPMEMAALRLHVHTEETSLTTHLRFLKKIGVLQYRNMKSKKVWAITPEIMNLCHKLLPKVEQNA